MNEYLNNKVNKFQQALETFKKGLEKESPEDLEIDGLIQRFEYCYELSWKTLKLVLKEVENVTANLNSPNSTLKQGFLLEYIQDEELWLALSKDRNQSTHTYNRELAQALYKKLPGYYQAMLDLLNIIISKL